MTNPLTHFNEEGRAKMVDVSDKTVTERIATATQRASEIAWTPAAETGKADPDPDANMKVS